MLREFNKGLVEIFKKGLVPLGMKDNCFDDNVEN